jgi:hypothetical protein
MSGIWNINSLYNANLKKVSSKLTFQLGEVFSARVVNYDGESKELMLKMLDGWQFPARAEDNSAVVNGELLRFQVTGFEEGKLKIKPVSAEDKNEVLKESSLENTPLGHKISRDESMLLEKMAKHNMPLTKDNISKVINLSDFIDRIKGDAKQEEEFISKYCSSRNVGPESSQGKLISAKLEAFFKGLKQVTMDDILLLMENNVELTTENLESFSKVFKGTAEIYNSINKLKPAADMLNKQILKSVIEESVSNYTGKNITVGAELLDELFASTGGRSNFASGEMEQGSRQLREKASFGANEAFRRIVKGLMEGLIETGEKDINAVVRDVEDGLKSLIDKGSSTAEGIIEGRKAERSIEGEVLITTSYNESNTGSYKSFTPSVINGRDILDMLKEKGAVELRHQSADEISEAADSNGDEGKTAEAMKGSGLNPEGKSSGDKVKEQIGFKTAEIKSIIKDILAKSNDVKPEVYSKVAEIVKNNINSFRLFNSISNQYYYFDFPIKLKDTDYPCKIIIKDDRKKQRKIDSKDVKLVVSVKTVNMGSIDGYINVKDINMDIDIRCGTEWIDVLQLAREKLIRKLSDTGYNVYIRVSRKEDEVNITNCRDFFEDYDFNNINVKV